MVLTIDTSRRRFMRLSLMWYAYIAPPIIWSAHLLVLYLLSSVTCGALSIDWMRVELGLVTVVALALIAAAGIAAFVHWKRRDFEGWPREPEDMTRESFMAYSGVAFAVLFFVGVLFSTAGFSTLYNCR